MGYIQVSSHPGFLVVLGYDREGGEVHFYAVDRLSRDALGRAIHRSPKLMRRGVSLDILGPSHVEKRRGLLPTALA